jgi:hypothetical protein
MEPSVAIPSPSLADRMASTCVASETFTGRPAGPDRKLAETTPRIPRAFPRPAADAWNPEDRPWRRP